MKGKKRFVRFPGIRNPEDLGVACLGSPHTAIVPPKRPIDRAEYGRRLAEAEGGVFAPSGYFAPINDKEVKLCRVNTHASAKGAIFQS